MIATIRGQLDTKRLASYLAKFHKKGVVTAYKGDDGYLFFTNGLLLIRAFVGADLAAFTPAESGLWRYEAGNMTPTWTQRPDLLKAWNDWGKETPIATLKATRALYECPHYKAPSDLYRKLVGKEDAQRVIWMNKQLCDLFSLDPDDLNDCLWELCDGGRVRVSCRYGITAYLMRMQLNADVN
jgi:hypothetical protein